MEENRAPEGLERFAKAELSRDDNREVVRRLLAGPPRRPSSQNRMNPSGLEVRLLRRGLSQDRAPPRRGPRADPARAAARRRPVERPGRAPADAAAGHGPQRRAAAPLGALRPAAREEPRDRRRQRRRVGEPRRAGPRRGRAARSRGLRRGARLRLQDRRSRRPRGRPPARRRLRRGAPGLQPGPHQPGDGHRRPAGRGRPARRAGQAALRPRRVRQGRPDAAARQLPLPPDGGLPPQRGHRSPAGEEGGRQG